MRMYVYGRYARGVKENRSGERRMAARAHLRAQRSKKKERLTARSLSVAWVSGLIGAPESGSFCNSI